MTTVVTQLSAEQVRYPLNRPFITALRTATTSIPACDLNLTLTDGRVSTGVAVPVEEVTGESIEDCLRVLNGPVRERVMHKAPDGDDLDVLLDGLPTGPAARSGLEMAWLAAKTAETPTAGISVLTDATVSLASTAAACTQAAALAEQGFTHLKIKADARADIARYIQSIAASVPGARLRIDPNQSWSLEQSVSVVEELAAKDVAIEFIEQPLPSNRDHELDYLNRASPFLIAVDESARSESDLLRLANHGVAIAIVKIGKSGGWTSAVRMIEEAKRIGMSVVVSSMLEPLPCVVEAARMAAAFEPGLVHDLDSALFFEEGPEIYQPPCLVIPPPDRGGKISTSDGYISQEVT